MTLEKSSLHRAAIKQSHINKLHKLGIHTILDLLHYFPRDHIICKRVKLTEAKVGETVTIVGKLKRHRIFTAKNGKLTIQQWSITNKSDSASITCTHFHNHPYYQSQRWRSQQCDLYQTNRIVMLSGKVKLDSYTGGKAIVSAEVKVIDWNGTVSDAKNSTIQPVYPLTKGVTSNLIQECLKSALKISTLTDPLPKVLREQYKLVGLKQAIAHIHFPANQATLEAARRRLVFDEFFYLQLRLLQQKQARRQIQRDTLLTQGTLLEQFYKILPFQLTQAQQRVVNEILDDLNQNTPMNRLVLGDVGSGKTVVAIAAILAAIQSGYQATLMAPTEVLAEQHFRKIAHWFKPLKLPVALLMGSTPLSTRQEIHQNLQTGKLPLLIGTHALIQNSVQFHQLGLVVIDEQHRFGVQQRLKLQQKGDHPHLLTMTATPIPRTLALTLHGDLDVSRIDELPPGRQAIASQVLTEQQRSQAHSLIWEQVMQGHQAYIVLPLVEDSDTVGLKSAIGEYQFLQDNVFPEFRIGLLHGRMNSAEKEEAIVRFRNCQTQVLVSTTVIEVGIDVSNATVILIEHAERFGLSQLHQLRGRVGRGKAKSYCLLINTSTSEETIKRMKVLEQSQNGFFIAEMDLHLRGPGEVLGTTQAGLPNFKLADLVKDAEILEQAREAAQKIIVRGANLKSWNNLMAELERRNKHLSHQNTALN
jgi:ATP-dependent DNA helicase RecG